MTILLRFDIDPIFLKMCVGIMLIFFLRTAFLLETKGAR